MPSRSESQEYRSLDIEKEIVELPACHKDRDGWDKCSTSTRSQPRGRPRMYGKNKRQASTQTIEHIDERRKRVEMIDVRWAMKRDDAVRRTLGQPPLAAGLVHCRCRLDGPAHMSQQAVDHDVADEVNAFRCHALYGEIVMGPACHGRIHITNDEYRRGRELIDVRWCP